MPAVGERSSCPSEGHFRRAHDRALTTLGRGNAAAVYLKATSAALTAASLTALGPPKTSRYAPSPAWLARKAVVSLLSWSERVSNNGSATTANAAVADSASGKVSPVASPAPSPTKPPVSRNANTAAEI